MLSKATAVVTETLELWSLDNVKARKTVHKLFSSTKWLPERMRERMLVLRYPAVELGPRCFARIKQQSQTQTIPVTLTFQHFFLKVHHSKISAFSKLVQRKPNHHAKLQQVSDPSASHHSPVAFPRPGLCLIFGSLTLITSEMHRTLLPLLINAQPLPTATDLVKTQPVPSIGTNWK